jgi:hypothetical protein
MQQARAAECLEEHRERERERSAEHPTSSR